MKQTLCLLALAASFGMASAVTLDELVTMDELVNGATLGSGVELATGYSDSDTVYTFDGTGAILDITNSTLADAFAQGSGKFVIAAWVKTTNSISTQSIFSTGGQSNGFKFDLTSGGLELTLKNVGDYASNDDLIDRTGSSWTLVAVSMDIAGGNASGRLYVTDTNGRYYSKTLGTMTISNPSTFAIGSGNSNNDRELFTGSIANLTIFSSDAAQMQNTVIAQAMGPAPVQVPEPATATLSLLALAGLAARRRRK